MARVIWAAEFGVGQKLVDERGEHLLPGHPGDSQAVGGFPLPDVEGPVGGGRKVDGATGPLDAPGDRFGP